MLNIQSFISILCEFYFRNELLSLLVSILLKNSNYVYYIFGLYYVYYSIIDVIIFETEIKNDYMLYIFCVDILVLGVIVRIRGVRRHIDI